MGGSQSTASISTKIKKDITNDTSMTVIRQNVTENVMKNIQESSKSCSAQQQNTNKDNAKIVNTGNCGVTYSDEGGSQGIDAKLNLSCTQSSQVINQMASNLANELAAKINTTFNTDEQQSIAAMADSAAQTGMGGIINPSSSSSNVNTDLNISITNKINNKLENIVKNRVEQLFQSKDVQDCLGTSKNTNEVNLDIANQNGCVDVSRGKRSQQITAATTQTCIQNSAAMMSAISGIKDTFNAIADSSVTTESKTKVDAKAESKAKSAGIEDVISSFFDGLSNFMGQFKWVIMGVVIFIIIAVIIFFYFDIGGDGGDDGDGEGEGDDYE